MRVTSWGGEKNSRDPPARQDDIATAPTRPFPLHARPRPRKSAAPVPCQAPPHIRFQRFPQAHFSGPKQSEEFPVDAPPAPPFVHRSARGQIAQLVEQRTENPRVLGSIPSLATILTRSLLSRSGFFVGHPEGGTPVLRRRSIGLRFAPPPSLRLRQTLLESLSLTWPSAACRRVVPARARANRSSRVW